MSDFQTWLNGEIRATQGRVGVARYGAKDFREIRVPKGQPRRQSYENLVTGERGVSRRQRDALVGSPLPRGGMTRSKAMEQIAKRLTGQGLRVDAFEGTISEDAYGRNRARTRERIMRQETDIDRESLDGVAAALEEHDPSGAAEAFSHAFLGAWWNGGDGTVDQIRELRMGYA